MLPLEMRLFVWNTNYFRRFGGAERAVHNLVNRFSELGVETFLIGQETCPRREYNEFFGPFHHGIKVYQGDFVNPWESSEGPLIALSKFCRYLVAAVRFGAFLRRHRPHIIHLHYVSWDVVLLAIYKRLFGYRLVITFRAGEDLIARQERFSRFKVRVALRSADRVTAISRDLCQRINALYRFDKVIFIPNGIDVDQVVRSALTSDAVEPGHFVFCGRIVAQKRVGFLVDAFSECIKRGCAKKLYLVGDGEELEVIRNRIESLGIQDQVVPLGALTHSRTLGVISQSRCLVLSSAFEGSPQVALEAMALGKPVIASDVGGLKDMVIHGESGFLYPADRQDLFCDYVMELAANDAQAHAFGRAGLNKLKASDGLDSVVSRYLDLYQELMSEITENSGQAAI